MYKSFYQLNKNFGNAMVYMLGDVKDYTGIIEATKAIGYMDLMIREDKEVIRRNSNRATADLFEEEASDIINYHRVKAHTIVTKTSGTMRSYYQIEDLNAVMIDITLLANNMLNVEED